MDADAVIIGGGPAGCSAAIWLHHLGFKVALIERSDRLGGLQNLSPYHNIWLGGLLETTGIAYAQALHRHITSLPVTVRFLDEVSEAQPQPTGWELILRSGTAVRCRFVILATGVRHTDGGFTPSERLWIGSGRIIDEADWQGVRVALLGGGDTAFENFHFIAEAGGYPSIFARTVRAGYVNRRRVPAEAVHIGNYAVDADTVTVNGVAFDRIAVMYGWTPNIPDWFLGQGGKLDTRGFIDTDRHRRTNLPQLFAIGEVTQHVHPCVATSLADGVIAAKAIQYALEA